MGGSGLAQLSNNLVYSAIAVYVAAMVAHAAEVAFGAPGPAAAGRADRLSRVALSLTVLAAALHAGGVLTRGLSAGRVPWGNMYEFSISGGLAVTLAYLALLRWYDVRYLGVVVVPAVLLTLGLAVTVLYTDAGELVPALRSVWLVVHVAAAVVSAGGFTVGAALCGLYLLRSHHERRAAETGVSSQPAYAGAAPAVHPRRPGATRTTPAADTGSGWVGRLPAAERLDRLAGQVHAFTFPLWTFAVVAGAIWAENAWGRYWGWDPKETWAFVTWVLYAAYLHARATAGWRGGRAAAVALTGWAALLFNYFGVNLWITGLHSYAGVG